MPSITVEDQRIASSYGLMDHFKNYADRMGVTPNTTLTLMTTSLANEIYRQCGNSYTSLAAEYCPTRSYILNKYHYEWSSGRTNYAVSVNIPTNYGSDQLIKLEDITYSGQISSKIADRIRSDSEDLIDRTAYYISYSNFYRNNINNMGIEITSDFSASPQFYGYVCTANGDGVEITSATIDPRDAGIIHVKTFKNTPTNTISQVTVSDIGDENISGVRTIEYKTRSVSAINVMNFPAPPNAYIVVQDIHPHHIPSWDVRLHGVASTNINSTPLPNSFEFHTQFWYSPTNSEDLTNFLADNDSVHGIFREVKSTTYSSSAPGSFITLQAPNLFGTLVRTRSTWLDYSKANNPDYVPYAWSYFDATNYDNTVVSKSYIAYYINDITDMNWVSSENYTTSIDSYIPVSVDFLPSDVYFKSYNMTTSGMSASNLNFCYSFIEQFYDNLTGTTSLRVTYVYKPRTTGTATLTMTATTYNGTTLQCKTGGRYESSSTADISRTITVNNAGRLDLNFWVGSTTAVQSLCGSIGPYQSWKEFIDDSSHFPYPSDAYVDPGNSLLQMWFKYRIGGNEHTEAIDIVYENAWSSGTKYRIHFSVIQNNNDVVSASVEDENITFSENVEVISIWFTYYHSNQIGGIYSTENQYFNISRDILISDSYIGGMSGTNYYLNVFVHGNVIPDTSNPNGDAIMSINLFIDLSVI